MVRDDNREPRTGPTESKNLRRCGNAMHENREIPWMPVDEGSAGRPEKDRTRTSGIYLHGKSDKPIVLMKLPNKGGCATGRRRKWREGV